MAFLSDAQRVNYVNQQIDDTLRLINLVQTVIANPNQANIDAVLAAQAGTAVMGPRPSYSEQGVSYQWESYRRALIASIPDLYKNLVIIGGPFEVRSYGA